jgi:hypothetical protein
MVKKYSSQTGSAFAVIAIILVVAIVGALGLVLWQNFIQSDEADNIAATQDKDTSSQKPCAGSGNSVEGDGQFCSEDVGVKFNVPEIFQGKFEKVENYDIFEGSMEHPEGSRAGKSIVNYEAVVEAEKETLSLSVAMEPLRSGFSSIAHRLQGAYFDASNGQLYLLDASGRTSKYDSTTDTYTTVGSFGVGESVPSFNVDSTKIYYGGIGDAGVVADHYLMVVNDKIVVIKIKHAINPMYNPEFDYKKSFADLNSYIKELKLL